MDIISLELDGPVLIRPQIFTDERGHFFESFNSQVFNDRVAKDINFVQDNESVSRKGTLRGLHFQEAPMAQGKLVRVTEGEVFDVAVDIRKDSETFGKWASVELSDQNKTQLWVPPGFAHGFLALSDVVKVQYKTTQFYSREHERTIRWNDSVLGINWPKGNSMYLSEKDENAPNLEEALARSV